MAKGSKGRRRIASRHLRPTPYPFRKWGQSISDLCPAKCHKAAEKKDWEDAMCSVCMEYPHNAVLLLCSSHEKGCRPYMCGTSCRYSNCLDQYKKAYTKMTMSNNVGPGQGTTNDPIVISDSSALPTQKCEVPELQCPLCRGQVKGWTVVEPARAYLNAKERTCMQENCSFVGTYKELRKHVRVEHPSARPREVDPALEQKWRRLERERERDDVISTIRSTMPGAMVFGDYVIEGSQFGFSAEDGGGAGGERSSSGGLEVGFDSNLVNVFLLMHAFGQRGNVDLGRRFRQSEVGRETPIFGSDASDQDNGNDSNDDDDQADDADGSLLLVRRLQRQGRVLLGRSGRRRRRREGNGNGGAR
ncbi:uncharacterized protein LOC116204047 [Punica granatum]|uniref:Uncharacterized protein LOC116204047 n=2 Tax=Punica granatum TaxID=22663 RepID=A0A6P8D5Y1_PUNGR|nr:uncharacterized protein LOC116204047 [Punica granatum]XP_031391952.1 uncharacterized protein LOC116204047 [Punica granatum]XP_031391953.1 uncharacterized protein LOC116204047 [Punica granatum]XP_031391954.1 uncharacterized protein LOC116204047 [Punica granatum]XP_031391955.1 uncharacterized protein LOC116204047 [Punica granatum]OWM84930.1 hypothetical protein CDL15_Pgr027717 [Punica granatum]PKI46009.1 hypothetical protein CRG98_033649 [Punica granatum]